MSFGEAGRGPEVPALAADVTGLLAKLKVPRSIGGGVADDGAASVRAPWRVRSPAR